MLASERLGRSDEKVLGKLEKKKARQREQIFPWYSHVRFVFYWLLTLTSKGHNI